MDYKKLVSLLAVSTLALAACDTEEPAEDPDVEEPAQDDEVDETDETNEEEDTEEEADGEGDSAHDIIDGIEGNDLGYTSDVELEIIGGTWTQDGYVFVPEEGEATVEGNALGEGDVFAYVIQDGTVVEIPEIEEGAFSFTASPGDEFQVGVSDEELWSEGDDADPEELDRWEIVSVDSGEEAAE